MAVLLLLAGVAVAITVGTGRASSLWSCIPGILFGLALGQTTPGIKTVGMLSHLTSNLVVFIGGLTS